MKYSSLNRGFPAGNPIANVFVVIVGTLVIAASLVLGFFAFIVLASIVLVLERLLQDWADQVKTWLTAPHGH